MKTLVRHEAVVGSLSMCIGLVGDESGQVTRKTRALLQLSYRRVGDGYAQRGRTTYVLHLNNLANIDPVHR